MSYNTIGSHVFPPPSCRRGHDFLAAAAELLSLLDIDDREDDIEATSAFTLIAAPSTVSSLGQTLSSRTRRTTSAVAAQGASNLPVPSTPVCTEGGNLLRGGCGRKSPGLPSKTSTPTGGNSPVSPMLGKKVEVPQFCIFIDEEKLETLCFGRVGSSNRFCLAPRPRDFLYSHCRVTAHGKGSNGRKKFTPMVNTYYVPGGGAG